jgi:phosphohistidine swiveling domain-containing protein
MPVHTFFYPKLKPHTVVTHNPNHAWLEKNYPGYLHTIFMQGIHAGVFLMNKYFPFGFKHGYTYSSTSPLGESELDWFWDVRELDRVRGIFLQRNKRSLGFFNAYYRWWKKRCADMLKLYAAAEHWDFQKMSDPDLYEAYEKLYWTNITQGAAGYLADCFLTVGETDWLSDFIRSRAGHTSNIEKIITTLTAPAIPSFSNEEEIALSRIADRIKNPFRTYGAFKKYIEKKPKINALLAKHARNYYWVENNYFAKILTIGYFTKKLFKLVNEKNRQHIVKNIKQNRRAKSLLLHKLGDRWLAHVVSMSEQMTHVQDYRKLGLIRFGHYAHIIFTEMARRTNLDEKDYHNVIEPEMADVFLKRHIDRKKLWARRTKNFTYGTPRGYVVYEGKELKKYVDDTQFHQDHSGITTFKGVPACVGNVTGTARLVRNAHKVGIFNTGDILVTNNTTPEFVPIIKRAGAIITDQGGITCHAAIISRELNIPCVIGTKIATKVLKDGDRVEVDATNGIVKINK